MSKETRSANDSRAAVSPPPRKLDLSRIRHDLRTPINHILGYCEMLIEEESVPRTFLADLRKIHNGGRQLVSLINEYFDDDTFETKARDLHQLCHELRTPVNHIIGYSEILQEHAEDIGRKKYIPDLKKIHAAATTWLALMEEYLVTPQNAQGTVSEPVLNPGIGFQIPSSRATITAEGSLLVVDDDDANRDMLSRRLRHDGYTVTVAASGLEALKLLRTHTFDLVLLDLLMPGLDGFQVLSKLKADPTLRDLPVIMVSALDQEEGVARAIEAGAEDYLAKPCNPVFLRARISACLEKRKLRERERTAFEALQQSQKLLSNELAEAAAYVQSLLPAPLEDGPVVAHWRFHPSTQLGGDAFGYHWLDDTRLSIYLLDVCGHGVGAALLSVSVVNVLKTNGIKGVDFGDPAAVLGGLNATFQMERHRNMFFTMWYGVYSVETRQLTYASGGHPPAVVAAPGTAPQTLSVRGPIVGGFPDINYTSGSEIIAPGSFIYIFSDGIYELARPDGTTVQLEEFLAQLAPAGNGSQLDRLVRWAGNVRNGGRFEDDLSIVELRIS